MTCIKCPNEIPAGRLKALPTTKVCVACSTDNKFVIVIDAGNKEGDDVEIINTVIRDQRIVSKINIPTVDLDID